MTHAGEFVCEVLLKRVAHEKAKQNGNRGPRKTSWPRLRRFQSIQVHVEAYGEFSSSTQASVVSQRPQMKKELFFPSFPPSRRALKHPGWWKIATEAMGGTVVRTTRGNPFERAESTRIHLPERVTAIQRYRVSLQLTPLTTQQMYLVQ